MNAKVKKTRQSTGGACTRAFVFRLFEPGDCLYSASCAMQKFASSTFVGMQYQQQNNTYNK